MTKQQLNESRKKTYEVRIWLMIEELCGDVLYHMKGIVRLYAAVRSLLFMKKDGVRPGER